MLVNDKRGGYTKKVLNSGVHLLISLMLRYQHPEHHMNSLWDSFGRPYQSTWSIKCNRDVERIFHLNTQDTMLKALSRSNLALHVV